MAGRAAARQIARETEQRHALRRFARSWPDGSRTPAEQAIDDDVALMTKLSWWPGGRALYDPCPGEPRTPGPGVSCRFYYSGDTP